MHEIDNPNILEKFTSASLPEQRDGLITHTASSLGCYMRCPKLYEYKYEMGYRSAAPIPPYLIGTAVHIGLEHFWKGASYVEAMAEVSKWMKTEPYFSVDGKVEQVRISSYLKGYYKRWSEDLKLYDVVSAELQFYIPKALEGANPYSPSRAGKLDVLVRRKSDGRLIIIEHKTAGAYSKADEAGSAYWTKLSMDTQLAFYTDCVRNISGEMPLVMYDVILKTRSAPLKSRARKKKDETPGEFEMRKAADCETLSQYHARLTNTYVEEARVRYFRKEVNITGQELETKLGEINQVIHQIENNEIRIRNTSACSSYGSTCEFMGVCTGLEQLDDSKFEKKETAHEELQQQKEAL